MQTPSSNDRKIKQSNRNPLKESFLAGLGGFIFLGLQLGLLAVWFDYDDKNSERSFVIATVDEWSKSYGGGHGGGVGGYSIKVTLADGSKASASAIPLGPDPPKSGEKIQLVKIISVLGITSYRWERPYWTWDDGTLRANKLLW